MQTVWLIIKWLLILVVVLLIFGFIYEQYALYRASQLPMDGKFVEVNAHKLHVVEKGEGKFPVIFESGWEVGGHLGWNTIQNEIAKETYTLSYDRAGILRSESSDEPRTCTNVSEELHLLLTKEKVEKPYILVAHSLGGIFMRCYAKKYRDEIAGIVLVDSAHPHQMNYYKKSIQERIKNLPSMWLVKLESYSGIARGFSYFFTKGYHPSIPSDDIRNSKYQGFVSKGYITYMREGKQFINMGNEVNGTNFGATPLTVLSAKESEETQGIILENWEKLQNEIATLSTNSKHIWVDSGHYIQLEKPEVVIDVIKNMLKDNR
jgi:pimeloyl-ACP methyl ester carboxylesterase